MAINVTNRKATFTGNVRTSQSFTVALECENTTDVEAYAADGSKFRKISFLISFQMSLQYRLNKGSNIVLMYAYTLLVNFSMKYSTLASGL